MTLAQAPTSPAAHGETDPSMDDILASIRRILSDEEKAGKAPGSAEGVLMLEPSMVVDETAPAAPPEPADQPHVMTKPEPPPSPNAHEPRQEHEAQMPRAPAAEPFPVRMEEPPQAHEPALAPEPLVAPAAAAAAASSVGTLMRTLVAERNAAIHRGGPSIEDLVREEIRPLLKDWLDTHLPGLVERLVRAEIERVVGRITG